MPSHLASGVPLDNFVDLSSLPKRRHFATHPFIERLRKAVQFDYIAITGIDVDNYRFGSGQSIDTDFPPAFLDAFYGDGLLVTDPFILASRHATNVIFEEEVYKRTPPPQRLRYLARTFGIFNRTLIPLLRGNIVYGAVTFARVNPFDDDEISFLEGVAEATHATFTRPIMERFSAESLKLSSGEIVCLKLASRGETSDEISVSSGYAVDTVNTYIKMATKKLGASNRTHAIAEAIRRRLID
jgi:LuxR family transcriptional regulator